MRCLRWQSPNINYILAKSNVCCGTFSFQRLTQNEELIRNVAFNYLETKWSESYQNNFVAANMIVVIILFFLFHLILIKRLQGFNSSPLLLRNQPEKEIIYVQTHTLIPAL